MNSHWIHFLATLIWGVFGIVIGSLVVVHQYASYWAWLAVIAAIVGNSAHLVAFAVSKKGVQISAQKQGT